MESNQTPLLQQVIYDVTGTTLDTAHVTLSAAGEFWCFPGRSVCTASREDDPVVSSSRAGESFTLPNVGFAVEYLEFLLSANRAFVKSGQTRVESFPGVELWVVSRSRPQWEG